MQRDRSHSTSQQIQKQRSKKLPISDLERSDRPVEPTDVVYPPTMMESGSAFFKSRRNWKSRASSEAQWQPNDANQTLARPTTKLTNRTRRKVACTGGSGGLTTKVLVLQVGGGRPGDGKERWISESLCTQ